MDFISNKELQCKEMLTSIGVSSIDALFRDIPKELRLARPTIDDGLSEYEGMRLMEAIGAKNSYPLYDSYLGAGAYEHHVPALVGAICGKSEFLTAYTPYQPEASQGMLQSIFEFQTAICTLTGMDVANASVYDGASACAEAMLMAMRINKERNKVVISSTLNPHYRAVVDQYLVSHSLQIETIPFGANGQLDNHKAHELIDDQTVAVLVQYPSFFGTIDDIKAIAKRAKEKGVLTIICANPLVYGLFASAADLGGDIAVGDGQPFGIPLQFGGPYVGYMACRQELVRQLPGRIVGETVDTKGRRGFVLTLQAREQHIRREKATSNICTNQALAALASLIAMLWYGKEGIRELALTNFQRAAYLKEQLAQISGVSMFGNAPCFNEFAVRFPVSATETIQKFREEGIEPGLDLGRYYPQLEGYLLVAVTETKNKLQLDNYVSVARKLAHE